MALEARLNLVNHENLLHRVDELKNRNEDIRSKVGYVLKQLWNSERVLLDIQNLDVFENLKVRFPNFIDVIEYYEANAKCLYKFNLPFESQPVLLLGDPGLGKTFFVNELVRALQFPIYEISMNNVTASFAISGGSLQWSDGSVGFVAKSLASSKFANPFLLIDEVDKASGNSHFNPINPLYNLLEPHSASKFIDEALELEINASKINWVLTANYSQSIPEPILSRLKVFTVRQPNPFDMPMVIESIYSKIRSEKNYGDLLSTTIESSVIDKLKMLTPREIRMSLEVALMNALLEDRTSIQLSDLHATQKGKTNVIGFY